MKKFLLKFYDKILFFGALTIFFLQFALPDKFDLNSQQLQIEDNNYEVSNLDNKTLFSLSKETNLMPGQSIYVRQTGSEEWTAVLIESIMLERRSKIKCFLSGNRELVGTLVSDYTLNRNWNKVSESIGMRVGRETQFLNSKEIVSIHGLQRLVLSASSSSVDWSNVEVSTYQRIGNIKVDDALSEKIRWVGNRTESDQSGYDLFTPPIIYIHDGQLTSRIPEPDKKSAHEEEPFGLALLKSSKSLYSIKLSSWVGETPYFEDLLAPLAGDSGAFTRNRLEVGKFYKRDLTNKPGQPSLIECLESDPNKFIQLQHFVVQQHKNSQTGGVRLVGRALIKDFELDIEPFEINSLMKEVYAGDIMFDFEFSLPGISPTKFSFNSRELEREFSFSGRKYLFSSIDVSSGSLTIVKKDPRFPENISKKFTFPK
jgi:hypothetical protein